jgi:hypothetical protein
MATLGGYRHPGAGIVGLAGSAVMAGMSWWDKLDRQPDYHALHNALASMFFCTANYVILCAVVFTISILAAYAEAQPMVIAFHANCVAIEDMDDFWLLGFADDKFATRKCLTLQRSYEDDEQDIKLGMNTYHVERDDQGFSCYGGIERFELYRDHVVVTFTPTGAERLKTDGMEITFKVDGRQFKKLVSRLGRIFAETECLAVQA